MVNISELYFGLPIIIISLWSITVILVDALSGKNKDLTFYYTILGLILTGAAAAYTLTIPLSAIHALTIDDTISKGMLRFGGFSAYFDLIFVVAGILTLFLAKPYLTREFKEYKEFYSLIIFSINGMIIIAHSNNLLTMFLGIELMSIPFYVLSGFIRTRQTSVESALKYFLLGSFATGFLVYGMAMIYGATGTLSLEGISTKLLMGNVTLIYLKIGMGLLLVGLCFKVAAFPFHQWAPDVYQGAPTIVTGFMSTAGKAASLAAFIIVAQSLIPIKFESTLISDSVLAIKHYSHTIQMTIAVISALTMLIGNLSALMQKDVKRMLAYSSVAHAGYLLIGIVGNNESGFSGILFYATAYMFMQIGSFAIVGILENNGKYLDLKDYNGLRKNHPFLAASMAIFMLSLAGIPPFAGFPGKYMLFKSAIESGFTWLTLIAVVSSIISVYFYIGLIVNMYFKESEGETPVPDIKTSVITLTLTLVGVVVLGILPSLVLDPASYFFK